MNKKKYFREGNNCVNELTNLSVDNTLQFFYT